MAAVCQELHYKGCRKKHTFNLNLIDPIVDSSHLILVEISSKLHKKVKMPFALLENKLVEFVELGIGPVDLMSVGKSILTLCC